MAEMEDFEYPEEATGRYPSWRRAFADVANVLEMCEAVRAYVAASSKKERHSALEAENCKMDLAAFGITPKNPADAIRQAKQKIAELDRTKLLEDPDPIYLSFALRASEYGGKHDAVRREYLDLVEEEKKLAEARIAMVGPDVIEETLFTLDARLYDVRERIEGLEAIMEELRIEKPKAKTLPDFLRELDEEEKQTLALLQDPALIEKAKDHYRAKREALFDKSSGGFKYRDSF